MIRISLTTQIQCLLQGTVLRGKQKADRLEAIIVTLHQLLAENDRWGASKTRLAEDTLDSIMDALLAIGQLKTDADSSVKYCVSTLVQAQMRSSCGFGPFSLIGAMCILIHPCSEERIGLQTQAD